MDLFAFQSWFDKCRKTHDRPLVAGGRGHRPLFDNLDLTVAPGEVVGIVWTNGAGKSTQCRILAGDLAPQASTVALAPSNAFVGWLPQERERVPGETVAGYIAHRTGRAAATREMGEAAEVLTTRDATDASGQASLAGDEYLASDGYCVED